MRRIAALFLLAALMVAGKSGGSHSGHPTAHCSTCTRTSKGKIHRSPAAVREFKVQTGYPHGRKGYIIDHIRPLCKGGADAPWNMQWQTKADAKIKDRTECR